MFSECGGWNCLNSGDMAPKRGNDGCHHGSNMHFRLSREHNCEIVWPDNMKIGDAGAFSNVALMPLHRDNCHIIDARGQNKESGDGKIGGSLVRNHIFYMEPNKRYPFWVPNLFP